MAANKHVRWLYGELPALIQRGVLDAESADRVRAHFGPVPEHRPRATALMVFGALGAALIGLGIILILAHNWDDFPRPLRAGITFSLLLSGQALAGFALMRRKTSRALNEAAALFLALCIAAAIALIGQTYNIPGNLGSFLMTWMLLVFPLIYLMDAGAVAIGYLAGMTWWAGYVRSQGDDALVYWPLVAAAVPFLIRLNRREPDSLRTLWMSWGACILCAIAPGLVPTHYVRGLWIPLYASVFGVLYLAGSLWLDPDQGIFRRPFRNAGMLGLGVIALALTFRAPWEEMGRSHYYDQNYVSTVAISGDYAVTGAFSLAAIALLIRAVLGKQLVRAPLAFTPVLAVAGFIVVTAAGNDLIPWAVFNAYVFVISILTIAGGVRVNDLRILNEGMLLLAGLVAIRFFDSDLSFVERGVAFIVIGIGFLAANLTMVARKRKAEA